MATFSGTYLSAGIILLSSLLVGRAVLLGLGRHRATFLEGPVGLAVLILICAVAIRLPGDAATSLVCCAIVVVASIAFLVVRREAILGPAVGLGLPVALIACLLVSLPFIASGHLGIPGVGLNNDMAMHLVDTDYLLDPHGPQPQSIVNGYPIGPHSLVATVANLLGTEPLNGWLGLLLASPVLTAITSLGLLRELPGWRHILGASLVGLAYLSASVLGIAGFKELIAGMFLIAFAVGLREIEREADGRIATVIGLALITAAMVPVYSLPGVGWLAITAGLWLLAHLLRIRAESGPAGVRRAVRASRPIVIPAAIVLIVVGLIELPKVIDFVQSGSIGNVADTNSKLRFVVSPLETLGVWPSGNWLLGTHDFSHEWAYWLFGLIGLAGLIVGFAWWMERRDYAVPAAVVSGFVIYLLTKYIENGGLYILAKAVVVPASVVMLLVITALLAPGAGPAKRTFAVAFIALAAYSSFLALRDTIVAPTGRLEQLAGFRSKVAGQNVLALTSDRFTDYALRTATVYSPAYNSEIRVDSTGAKTQRLPIDFDSVPYDVLNQFPYAVTTSAVYQSQAPPGWTLAASNSSYRLWSRTGTVPTIAILAEEARPGRVFRCKNAKFRSVLAGGGEAVVWPRPVIAKRLYWKAGAAGGVVAEGGVVAGKQAPLDNNLSPGQTASQTISLPPGQWKVSIQYVSPVTGIHVRAPGLDTHLPAGMDAAIPYRPDQGPYWPAGEVTSRGGPITFSVQADDVNWLQRVLGVDAPAVIGNLTAVNRTGFRTIPTGSACSLYVDHVIGGNAPARSGQKTGRSGKQKSSGK
ncbi:MAG TPA: hypothetical protein VLB79_09215 [Solirubrobacterales bacterium]|nr:hypothetical protein [Solirubrobacterales bacterium]